MLSHTLAFLTDLKDNNNKAWFDAHKKDFEKAKTEFIAFIAEVIRAVASFDKSVEGHEAKNCIFRIYRDIRFSNDKTPYKNHFGAFLTEQGRKSNGPGYYIHIQPQDGSFLGGGIYMPEAPVLQKIRQEIDYNGDTLKAIMEDPSFKKYYPKLWEEGKLSRPPKGYEAENPHIELLKLKSFVADHALTDQKILNSNLVDTVHEAFIQLHKLNTFLKEAIS